MRALAIALFGLAACTAQPPAQAPITEESMSARDQSLSALQQTTAAGPLAHLPVWSNIRPEDVVPGTAALLETLDAELTRIEQSPGTDWATLMVPLERINLQLGRVTGPISHLLSVKYSDALQTAFDEVRPDVVAFGNRLSQSQAIYRAMRALRDSSAETLDTAQRRILDESIRGMERSGVHLEGEAKARYQDIQTRLAELSNDFRTNLVKEEKEVRVTAQEASEVAGIPSAVLEMAAKTAVEDGEAEATAESGPWHFVVNGVNFAVVTYGEHRPLREAFYRAYRARGTSAEYDNRPIVDEIVTLRQELAQLVGFDSYASLSIDAKMAPSVDAVWSLLGELETAAKPAASRELDELVAFMKERGAPEADDVQPWDISFWSEKLQEHRYGYDSEAVREYFQLPIVLEGLFNLNETLYGAQIVDATQSAPLWDDDMMFFEVRQNGKVIAGFYLDPYARPGEKRGGAWMNTVVDRTRLLAPTDGTSSLPVALMVMNARPPADGKPALMSLDEVRTLFHEFGHAQQLLFTQIEEGGASGLDLVEWDAVELASQFNEYWMDYPPFLKGLSNHVDTGEPLDDDLIARIIDSANYMAGNATLRQLLFGKSDLLIHQRYATEGENRTPTEMERAVAEETIVLPMLDTESQLPAFGHLFAGGYAAGYYSYKWAEVLAADAFGAFQEVGLDNDEGVKQVATRFKDTVLALGGSKSAGEIYREFRGRDADADALLRKQGLK